MRHRALVAAVVALFALSVSAQSYELAFPAGLRFVLPAASGPGLLRQCSRATPQAITGYWEPSQSEIQVLEAALVKYLNTLMDDERPPHRTVFHRQYIGVFRGDTKLIYGNFYPGMREALETERTRAAVVCDGGSYHWGIVYDPARGQFSELSFNGVA
jgi:hypothetical protein